MKHTKDTNSYPVTKLKQQNSELLTALKEVHEWFNSNQLPIHYPFDEVKQAIKSVEG